MDREKLQKALQYATENPQSEFAIELKNRIKRGEFNSVLKAEGVDTKPYEQPKKKGFISRIGNALIKSEKNFGEDIAGALNPSLRGGADIDAARATQRATQDQLIKVIQEKKAKGEDATKYVQMLKDMGNTKIVSDFELNPALVKTNKQILGDAAGVAVDILGAGTLAGKGAGIVTQPTTLLRGAAQGLKEGAIYGAAAGAGQGAARAAQQDATGGQIVEKGLEGGIVGGVLGGGIGALTGGLSGYLNGRAIRKQELQDLLDSGDLSNKKLAEFDIEPYNPAEKAQMIESATPGAPAPEPKVTSPVLQKDKKAVAAIKQGFDEADVAVIKTMTSKDKEKALKMIQLAEDASNNRRSIDRPFDVVGDTVLEPAKKVAETLKTTSKELDGVAKGLQGQTLNGADDVIRSVDDDLAGIGASVDDAGGVNFEGSDFENLGGNESIIRNVYRRLKSANDAYDFHRIKRYIDTNVDYGKSGEGLTRDAQTLLKGWRKQIDAALDGQFADYDRVNTVLSDTLTQLDELSDVMGTSFNVSDPLANIKAGQVSSRILSNSSNRGQVLRLLENLQKTAEKYGYKREEDVINQVIFADMLEDVFGTQATRSLRGQVQRGVTDGIEETIGPAMELTKGNITSAVAKGLAAGWRKFKGVTVESQAAALRELLGG